jgi:hypothetical protein
VHAGNQALRVCTRASAVTAAGVTAGPASDFTWFPGNPADQDDNATAGFAWRLPDDPSCAGSARAYVRQALAGLRLPEELIDDAELAVSELAVNAWQHALDSKPLPEGAGPCAALPELWLYRRGTTEGAELVCGVFDTRRDAWPRLRPDSLRLLPDAGELADPLLDSILADDPESGRGLGIVQAVSQATGCHRTRSRLNGLPVPGKVAWFTMKIPASSPAARLPPAELTPVQAAHTLSALLSARGIPGISHHHGTQTQSVVSIAAGLTVRCRDGIFRWLADGVQQRAFFDLADTVEDIIRLHENLASAGLRTGG